ncbi:MAG: hypothetical protein FJY80_01865 [Candidatus Aminicenantes bacterium]|nr:hypothetical protein [Candidatus Aminicenantes bacterium]
MKRAGMKTSPFLVFFFGLAVSASAQSKPAAAETVFDLNARDIPLVQYWRFQTGDDPKPDRLSPF